VNGSNGGSGKITTEADLKDIRGKLCELGSLVKDRI
jgi:hypothetical protein